MTLMWADIIRRFAIAAASLSAGLTLYISCAAAYYRAPFHRRPIYPLCWTLTLCLVFIAWSLGERVGHPLSWRAPFALVIDAMAIVTLVLTAAERRTHFRRSEDAARKMLRSAGHKPDDE